MKLNTGPELVEIDGMLVEVDALRIAKAVKAYDENLEILCLDPARAEGISDEPYVLVEKCTDGQYRKIAGFWKLDESVMQTVEAADGQRHDLIAVINGKNERVKRDRDRRYKEIRDETKDIVAHIAGMRSTYTVTDPRTGELVAFYDDRPAVRGKENISGKKNF